MNEFLVWPARTLAFLDAHNGAVTAVATIFIAAFTAVLVSVTGRQARLANVAIKLGRDEFEAEHRLWIAIRSVRISGPIVVNEAGFIIPVEFTLENTGTTPATEFLMYGEALSQRQDFSVEDILTRLINAYDSNKKNPYLKRLQADVIFPKEAISHQAVFAVNNVDAKISGDNTKMVLFSPVIVGAFFYRSPFDKTNRYTTFVYTASARAQWLRMDDEEEWPDIEPDEVRVDKWHVGWTAS